MDVHGVYKATNITEGGPHCRNCDHENETTSKSPLDFKRCSWDVLSLKIRLLSRRGVGILVDFPGRQILGLEFQKYGMCSLTLWQSNMAMGDRALIADVPTKKNV
jgi:hypothetical protein